MATKAASFGGPLPHTSGLFADMTVDGPEIGTLVLVVDRAKNLPNRKTMGKQNPYCAARLGKEARKTETDKRGGQTPRWDQELRFTVHDSPDYHKLKISAFSEDKRTDLIGEAWVDLTKVVIPGGGKDDLWQGLNYKGKYAGELRIELTYYDSRPKPDNAAESVAGTEELRQSVGSGSGRVKRRPLPSNPNSGHVTPDMIPAPAVPGRARHGPRDFRTPPRANSMPPETTMQTLQHVPHAYNSSPVGRMEQTPSNQYYGDYGNYDEPAYGDEGYDIPAQPDFLPQLPPSNRQRERQPPPQQYGATRPHPAPTAHPHVLVPHSYSAPVVPQTQHSPADFDDGSQLNLEYPEPIPDLEYQHQQLTARRRMSSVSPDYEPGYDDPFAIQPPFGNGDLSGPPPPPVHSNSAPVVPHYGQAQGRQMSSSPLAIAHTPPHNRHHSVPNASPQHISRGYNSPQHIPVRGYPARGSSVDEYTSSPEQVAHNSSPLAYSGQTPPSFIRPTPLRPLPHRNSVADPYQITPPRPHPLSQEVPRPRSPLPPLPQQSEEPSLLQQASHPPYQQDYRGRDAVPLIKPRALSPQPPPPPAQANSAHPRSTYSIQHPVRAFESADESPLSTSHPPLSLQTSQRSTPARKSIPSHPGTPNSAPAGVPYSPDDFIVHNPSASQPTLPEGNSPHSPYQILPGTVTAMRNAASGPIVGWHGQEIDPSDHLPVDCWAPEPEKKTPTRTYGLGRDRDFGPRSAHDGGRSVPKDTVVNFRMKSHSQPVSPAPVTEPESPTRNRLQKKSAQGKGPAVEPLRERHNFNSVSVPNPYAQQEYSQGFYGSGADYGDNGYVVDSSPSDRLVREISSIDIGSGAGRSGGGGRSGFVPSPTAYVPVRSHRDRNTFY